MSEFLVIPLLFTASLLLFLWLFDLFINGKKKRNRK